MAVAVALVHRRHQPLAGLANPDPSLRMTTKPSPLPALAMAAALSSLPLPFSRRSLRGRRPLPPVPAVAVEVVPSLLLLYRMRPTLSRKNPSSSAAMTMLQPPRNPSSWIQWMLSCSPGTSARPLVRELVAGSPRSLWNLVLFQVKRTGISGPGSRRGEQQRHRASRGLAEKRL